VISPVAATDGARSRHVIVMNGSDFVRFRATSCCGRVAGNNREQNDRQNAPFHRPPPWKGLNNRTILRYVML
jgi:hypothetical protein